MGGKKRLILIVALSMLIALVSVCYGNSAEPPSILIIVPNAPEDLEVSIGSGNTNMMANIRDKVIEKYYAFYSSELRIAKDYTVRVSTRESSFEIVLEKPLKKYNNIYTLNLADKTLKPGKLLSRSIILVSMRIIMTLAIEAIIFWLFGFRNKKSWIVFLIINIITQGALNIWLNGSAPLTSYLVFSLIFMEFFVIIAEIIAFLAILKERGRGRTLLYVIAANFLSLLAGGYIITVLPV
ncbi:MAG TPA: hypothetical protein PLG67_11770 [Bacillota bacterium]|jgi:hypothetical protein|nr:hypothetical protein [Bacillota bacterium]HRS21256.1 hypothetical protein [Clostridia bacterium]HQE65616.1 hypothetical protein [Bacillota bacterium]HQI15722.1 hypothetical protein [Bacillota bacterium]HQJ38218.1 hypothetical protein [Bacillota bacterium]